MRLFATSRALLVNSRNELLILRRSASDPAHPGMWDIPGGRQESGEDIRAAAERETLEEAGVRLQNPQLAYSITSPRPEGSGTWLFFAERVADDVQIKLGDEHDDYKWVPFADLPKYTDYTILLSMHGYIEQNNILSAL